MSCDRDIIQQHIDSCTANVRDAGNISPFVIFAVFDVWVLEHCR